MSGIDDKVIFSAMQHHSHLQECWIALSLRAPMDWVKIRAR